MTVTITFTIDDAEYRALERIATARQVSLPNMYRTMGRNLIAAVADGRAPLTKPKPAPEPVKPKAKRAPSTNSMPRVTPEQQARIRELHTAMKPAKVIGQLVGISENTVRKYIPKLGLTPHPPGRRPRVEAPAP